MHLLERASCALALLIATALPLATRAEEALTFAASDDWLPYSSAQAPEGGLLVKISRAALRAAGRDSHYVFPPWNRAIEEARAGAVTGIVGAWHSAEREKDFLYSAPIIKNDIVFFAFADRPIRYQKLADLQPYRIGAVRGNSFIRTLQQAHLRLDLATSQDENLRKFINRRFDILVDERRATELAIRTRFPGLENQIVALQPPLETNYLYLIVSKRANHAEQIVTDFNKGLATIEKDGTLKKIYRESGF
ncbi:substrate-binding periplasmic protein [Niveibacterium terrae]|uniref:substrate-binding periplasmic protein n=1 Tax=Niveibacterium terrae TaxID=3373598 RepID=UPI003A8E45AC